MKNKYQHINEIRRLPEIEDIINECEGFGRTWGKNLGSIFHGSHIIFIQAKEVIIICQQRKGNQKIYLINFSKNGEKDLFNQISKVLVENNIDFEQR